MENTQIIILAAGKGSRMGGDIPKALTELSGRSMVARVVETIESLPNYHKKPIVVVGYKSDMITEALGDRAIYAIQGEQKGTGHAVMSAAGYIDPSTERVLILYADQPFVSAETIQSLVENKKASSTPLSIATAVIDSDDLFRDQFYNFGRIVRGDDGEIVRIVEKKDALDSELLIREVNPAYFCCDVGWMLDNLKTLSNNNAQNEYYLTDLVRISFDQKCRIDSIQINEREALGANTREQLRVLESFVEKQASTVL